MNQQQQQQQQQQQLLSPPQQPVPITNEDIYMRVLAIGDSQQNGELRVNHLEQRQQQPSPPIQQQQQQPLPPLQQEERYRHPVPYVLPVGGFVPKPSTEQQREHGKKVAREHVFQLFYGPVCSLDAEKAVYAHNVCRDAATRLGEAVINAYDCLDQGKKGWSVLTRSKAFENILRQFYSFVEENRDGMPVKDAEDDWIGKFYLKVPFDSDIILDLNMVRSRSSLSQRSTDAMSLDQSIDGHSQAAGASSTVSHTDPVVFSVPSSLRAAVSSSSSSSSRRPPPQQLDLYQDNRRPSIIPATRPPPSPSSSTSSTSTTQSHRPKKGKARAPPSNR
ncbi:hypothetical protein INT45_005261 [Circinella minor]|uniref:Uncharacterized protein n=1 Tax=Circinella minor TaxID=1195481 RepID=A0A8H7VHL7_9FUNG|nr:hypothetical protein INT45_005261 [Circinella minor]